MEHESTFSFEINEFSSFLRCLKKSIVFVQFSCSHNKIIVGGIDEEQSLSMFAKTIPEKYESTKQMFDVAIPVENIVNVFNIYRQQQKESSNELVNISLCSNDNEYQIQFLEYMSNKGEKYNVRSWISGKLKSFNKINIHDQKIPNYLRKIKCPTQIVSKILGFMENYYINVTLTCRKSSLIISNENYSYEILDETIFSNVDIDSYITVNLKTLNSILETSTTKYIDMYFTGENLLALSSQNEKWIYTYYLVSV